MKVREIMGLAAEFAGRRDVADFLGGRSGGERRRGGARGGYAACAVTTSPKTSWRSTICPSSGCSGSSRRGSCRIRRSRLRRWRSCPCATAGAGGCPLPRRSRGCGCARAPPEITYAVRPQVKKMDDDAEECWRGNARLLALCTACEYALMSGMFEAAAFLDKRCRDALACACREPGRAHAPAEVRL